MEEIISVVDEKDILLRGEDRKKVHASTFWHRGIHVFLFNKKGELLVQLRSPDKDKYPNTFDCSVSGHVDYGNGYLETANREMNEEVGLDGLDLELLVHFRMVYGDRDYMISKLFRCEYGGEIKPNEEVSEIKFLKMDELKKAIIEKPDMFTPWFVEMLKWHFKMENKLHILKVY
ncbi:MAG: NUDIX domain-containing protein [Candidatus Aenigmatarchaeota archaeon]